MTGSAANLPRQQPRLQIVHGPDFTFQSLRSPRLPVERYILDIVCRNCKSPPSLRRVHPVRRPVLVALTPHRQPHPPRQHCPRRSFKKLCCWLDRFTKVLESCAASTLFIFSFLIVLSLYFYCNFYYFVIIYSTKLGLTCIHRTIDPAHSLPSLCSTSSATPNFLAHHPPQPPTL